MKRYISEFWPYALALFPVMLLRDFSPASELRYISMATELLNNNHLFCLTWQGENYYNEMPLLVWLIALLKVIFRHHYMIVIAGLLSFVPSMAILAIMNRWVERYDTKSFRLIDGSQSRMLASIMLQICSSHCGLYQAFTLSGVSLVIKVLMAHHQNEKTGISYNGLWVCLCFWLFLRKDLLVLLYR